MKSFDYESISPGYYHQAMLRGSSVQRFWHRTKFEAAASRIPKKPVRVLDIGSGPGSFFYVLRQNNRDALLFGTDIAQKQVSYASRVVPDACWFVSNASMLPVRPGSLDFVTMLEVLEHLPVQSEKKVLLQMRRSLKKGGRLVLSTPNYCSFWPVLEWLWNMVAPVRYGEQHINKKSIGSLVRSLKAAGFRVSCIRTFFILSPFASLVSEKLARWIFRLEQALLPFFGSIILVEAVA